MLVIVCASSLGGTSDLIHQPDVEYLRCNPSVRKIIGVPEASGKAAALNVSHPVDRRAR